MNRASDTASLRFTSCFAFDVRTHQNNLTNIFTLSLHYKRHRHNPAEPNVMNGRNEAMNRFMQIIQE
jgi:hypothetical protein